MSMEVLYTAEDLAARYAVTLKTARRYLLEQALAWARPSGLAFGDWSLHRNAARSIEVACVALGMTHASWNDLRRTHARWLRREGVAVELIGEQLRHTGPTMARRVYARITPGELGEQIEKSLERKGK